MANRREFIGGGLALAAAGSALGQVVPQMIIDAHVHFYDTSRLGGAPWPPQSMTSIYRPILPPELKAIIKPLGVTGVIAVEASGLVEDNQYLFNLADQYPIIFGVCGDLAAGKPGFAKNLERFTRDRRFLGIRCSDLWGRDFVAGTRDPAFIADIKLLAEVGLEMDYWGVPPELDAVIRLSDAAPDLRIVLNHLPYTAPEDQAAAAALERNLRELASRPHIYAKVTGGVVKLKDGTMSPDPQDYRPALDHLWDLFGQKRLIYESNWPLSSVTAPYPVHFAIVHAYFTAKGQQAADDYFWRNSKEAYRWSAQKVML